MATTQMNDWRSLIRRTPHQAIIIAFAILGLGISIYLTFEHYKVAPLVCSTTGLVDCAPVLTSSYSVIPGTSLPITLPGLFWFIASGALAGTGLYYRWQGRAEPVRLAMAQVAWSAVALLFVVYLVFAEFVQLHHICAWCTGVHFLVLLTLLVTIHRLGYLQEPQSIIEPAVAPSRVQRTPISSTSAKKIQFAPSTALLENKPVVVGSSVQRTGSVKRASANRKRTHR